MRQNGVLTGDVIGSTDLKDWRSVSSEINRLLKDLNKEFRDSILMDFHVTAGDEFQVALENPTSLLEAYRSLRLRMPVAFRCGMGIGGIEPHQGRDPSMRGQAFYRARRSIEVAKRLDRRSYIMTSSSSTRRDKVLNALLAFIDDIEVHWTERQRTLSTYYLLKGNPSLKAIATEFRVTPQSVSQTLRAARVTLIEEGENAMFSLAGETERGSSLK